MYRYAFLLGFGLVTAISAVPQSHNMSAMMTQIRRLPDAEQPQRFFQQFCSNCHDKEPMIDVNAPLIGDHNRWAPYRKMPKSVLLKLVMSGHGAMPPRGGCSECSEAELAAIVAYMLAL